MEIGGHWGQETGRHGIERGKEQAKATWVRWGKGGGKVMGEGGLIQREYIPEDK